MPQSRLTHTSSTTCKPKGNWAGKAIESSEVSVFLLHNELFEGKNVSEMLSWHQKSHYTLSTSLWVLDFESLAFRAGLASAGML